MSIWPFQRSREDQDAALLLAAVTRASRAPELYGPGRAPDTLEGRFELTTLFASLALIRLKAEKGAGALTQNFADALFSQFDAGLREAAVGDLSVPKRMHKMAGSFYGRLGAYASALGADEHLAHAIGRNIMSDENAAFAAGLAPRLRALAAKQAASPVADLLTDAGWKL
ncbi:MAG: ubiquinol-cytochrome C chaperone family protein [Terricaulis sp.]